MSLDYPDHPSHDQYLTALSREGSILGSFVRSFPGSALAQSTTTWLDTWFSARALHFYNNPTQAPPAQVPPPDSTTQALQTPHGLASRPFKLLDILPHFFRGFRDVDAPVILPDGLVVIDGPNSAGKTSLAEAFEWLFTGQLVRRTLHGQGAPRELECCIRNQLRPDEEDTWVEATLETSSGETIRIRRLLTADYGSTSTSTPSSKLFMNGGEVSPQEETALMEELACGAPPMLMQHTLRVFVQSSPSERRDYFERLLRLDELTYLVEKAVVGDTRLPDFRGPNTGLALSKWSAFKEMCQDRATKAGMTRAEHAAPDSAAQAVSAALRAALASEVPEIPKDVTSVEEAIALVAAMQRAERQQSFPILAALRPKRSVDDQLRSLIEPDRAKALISSLQQALTDLASLEKAYTHVGRAELAIASALDTLERAGLVVPADQAQQCPLCAYQPLPTLEPQRISTIKSWTPVKEAVARKATEVSERAFDLRQLVSSLTDARSALVPSDAGEEEWKNVLSTAPASITGPAESVRQRARLSRAALAQFDRACEQAESALSSHRPDAKALEAARIALMAIVEQGTTLVREATEYANSYTALDSAVGAQSREDPNYRLREAWLDAATDRENLLADMAWEQAKKKAQEELQVIRAALIEARQAVLGARRTQFSEGITRVWQELREDRYSAFSRLFIPDPRGRGFPVEIEVKALLDDGTHQVEVDALRVFSESQVHALGIAAFLTRARLLGHKCLILDDPVQSMDEEHFRTFASRLLPLLLSEGLQVIILTHNDLFSRDVSHVFAESDKYATLRIRHSRRHGCQLEEGNRRAGERIKRALALAEDGKLEDAWRLIRVAVERVYTCAMIKYGPDSFDPRSWGNQTAEYMWESGAGAIIQSKAPESTQRLKDILQLTVSGAHDKAPRGLADLLTAANDLRALMERLGIGEA